MKYWRSILALLGLALILIYAYFHFRPDDTPVGYELGTAGQVGLYNHLVNQCAELDDSYAACLQRAKVTSEGTTIQQ